MQSKLQGSSIVSIPPFPSLSSQKNEGSFVAVLNDTVHVNLHVEKHLKETTTQTPDATLVVQLPFLANDTKLGLSRASASKRIFRLERKVNANPELKKKNNEFIDLGHMKHILEEQLHNPDYYYLPVRCVHNQKAQQKNRESSLTSAQGQQLVILRMTVSS